MLTKSKDVGIKKLATLKKPPNCLTIASAQLYRLLHQERSKSVVLQVLVVMLLHLNLHASRAPTPHAAAEQPLYIINLYRGTLSHRSTEHSAKKSRDNYYCVWLYSLNCMWLIMRPCVQYGLACITGWGTVPRFLLLLSWPTLFLATNNRYTRS
jgi:hypothetical protein